MLHAPRRGAGSASYASTPAAIVVHRDGVLTPSICPQRTVLVLSRVHWHIDMLDLSDTLCCYAYASHGSLTEPTLRIDTLNLSDAL